MFQFAHYHMSEETVMDITQDIISTPTHRNVNNLTLVDASPMGTILERLKPVRQLVGITLRQYQVNT